MLSGKRFRLKRDTISIETITEDHSMVMIPSGSVIMVISGPRPDDKRMLDVLWENRTLVMFAIDLEARAEQITDKSSGA